MSTVQTDGPLFEDEQIRVDFDTVRFKDQTVPVTSITSVQAPQKSSAGCLVTGLGAVGFITTAIWGWRGMGYVQTLAVFAVIFVIGLWLQSRSRTQCVSVQIGLQWVEVYRSRNPESVVAVHKALTQIVGNRR